MMDKKNARFEPEQSESSSALEYATVVERATKSHQGGLNSNEDEAAAVMSEMTGNSRCPVYLWLLLSRVYWTTFLWCYHGSNVGNFVSRSDLAEIKLKGVSPT